MVQDILVYCILGIAIVYIVKRFFFKRKNDHDCDSCG